MFKTIGVYLPIRNEPDLLELYEELSAKMHLSLPVTIDKDQPLQFVRWKPGDPLVKGDYNVSIPAMREPVDMPEVLLIPCVGYTVNRFRLGYGGRVLRQNAGGSTPIPIPSGSPIPAF